MPVSGRQRPSAARRPDVSATVAYALAIGPLVHLLLPRLSVRMPEPATGQTAQATQVRADGRAANRSAGIGRPQTSQTP